jgi:thiol:disulfide interchange protein DsbD
LFRSGIFDLPLKENTMKRCYTSMFFAFALMPALFAQQFVPNKSNADETQTYAIHNPVKWEVSVKTIDAKNAELHFHAIVDSGWKVYAPHINTELPLPLVITLTDANMIVSEIEELTTAIEKYDELFEEVVRYFTSEFRLKMPVSIAGTATHIAGTIEYKACNMTTFACIQPEFDFDMAINGAASADAAIANAETDANEASSLWGFFLLAMLAGFAGVLTPCVFPMIPMNVSFFMRQASRRMARRQVTVFAVSIVLIYTLIGIIAAITKSASFASVLSAHWLPNLIFFALFIIFAASFLGAFNITLPQKFSAKADENVSRGGYLGAFFMALTLCIVSFSCTAPFVGALLVAAAQGAVLKPFVGMLGFGIAFALPFALLGLFPSAMKKMPKSGDWMNVVKVSFAFVLIMFGMKFLSAADADLGLYLISRELVVSVWIVCLVLWGFYILGRLPLGHEDRKHEIGAGRIFSAIVAFAAALYLLTAFFGAKISWIEGFLPEKTIIVQQSARSMPAEVPKTLCEKPLYSDNSALSSPVAGAYFDIEQAKKCAAALQRPLLLYFKGHSCANCKKMQNSVLNDAQVLELLQDKYVVAVLYTDDKTELPQSQWYVSKIDGKMKKNMGQQNLDYMMTHFSVNAIPFFAAGMDGSMQTMGYTSSTGDFLTFLNSNLEK